MSTSKTPKAETSPIQSYMEFVIEFITDVHFKNLDEKTKQQFYERFNSNMEQQLQNHYNKGFFEGKMEGMELMAEALKNSRK